MNDVQALEPVRFAYSYTGLKVGLGPDTVAPSLEDIAVSLGRICRYAGNCQRFWPVLLHSFVVADLLPPDLKIYGLVHDAGESIFSDIPRGFKTSDLKEIEEKIQVRILASFGIPQPTAEQAALVKACDDEALTAEVWVIGPPALRPHFPDRSLWAENQVAEYTQKFPPEDTIRPDGCGVMEFKRRVLTELNARS